MTAAPPSETEYESATAEIPFGERLSDGRIVTAAETARGIACDCICPQCGGALQAHQGDQIAWHFQHTAASPGGCAYGLETGLHKFSKQVIADNGGLFFPPLVASADGVNETVRLGRWGKLRSVSLEQRISIGTEYIVPDIVVETRELSLSAGNKLALFERTVFVEIFVNHKTQDEKRNFLIDNNIAAFEIDLQWSRDKPLYSWTADVLRDAPRYWIWHPELRAANDALDFKIRSRRQLLNKIKDQQWRFSKRNAEQATYKRELILRRDAICVQKQRERELDEYNLNVERDIEWKRRERERWLRETEKFMADRGLDGRQALAQWKESQR